MNALPGKQWMRSFMVRVSFLIIFLEATNTARFIHAFIEPFIIQHFEH